MHTDGLLSPQDPPPVDIVAEAGKSAFFLTCDHGGNTIPRALGTLGLSQSELERHIAWDIGAAGVARRLSAALDAFLIVQTYSRLVIDCNRAPNVPTSIVSVSETTAIPGNEHISAAEAGARRRAIFAPYHGRIAAELDARANAGRSTILVAVHSFTPVYKGMPRSWHAGVLFNRDPRLGRIVLRLLRDEPGLIVGENEPYSVSDETDYTIPIHGERRSLPHVELEIRQDLVTDAEGQAEWARRLARILVRAEQLLG